MVLRLVSRLIRAIRGWYPGSTRNSETREVGAQDVGASRELPATCLRGLRLAKWVLSDGIVDTAAFVPDDRTAATREDGAFETSVNWEDSGADVLALTLADRTNAEHGAEIGRASCRERV